MNPTSFNPIQFSGQLATRAAQNTLLSGAALKNILASDDTPYVGSLPAELLRDTPMSESQCLTFLDKLANEIRDQLPEQLLYVYSGNREANKKKLSIKTEAILKNTAEYSLQEQQFQLEYVENGWNSIQTKLILNGKPYAFKVVRSQPELADPEYTEPAVGTYFTHQNTRDLAKLYVSNPQSKWMLGEFITDDTHVSQRTGKTLLEQGFEFYDPDADKTSETPRANRINGIRVDYGCLTKVGSGVAKVGA
jgi:hypothetical protein